MVSGFRVLGLGLIVLGFRAWGCWLKVSGFRDCRLGFRGFVLSGHIRANDMTLKRPKPGQR